MVPFLRRMDGWYLVALVCFEHCCLLVLPFDVGALLLLSVTIGPNIPLASCSSRSWFCLVRCSTFTAKVYTYLLRVVVRGSSPLWFLVAIERVSIIQLFVWKVVIWLLLFSSPQMAPIDDVKNSQ